MKRGKKVILLIISSVFIMTLLVACGSDKDATNPTTNTEGNNSITETELPGENGDVSLDSDITDSDIADTNNEENDITNGNSTETDISEGDSTETDIIDGNSAETDITDANGAETDANTGDNVTEDPATSDSVK